LDNLTHTLLGAALARTRLGRLSPFATPALVVGANLPDLDAVVRLWAGREGYLVHHRGLTHAVPGIALQALLLAGGLRWLERRRAGRTGQPGGSWVGALTLAAIALGSHPLLDLLNIYGLRPWLPFDPRWYYGDIAFIVDPWMWLMLGAGALLAGPRSRVGSVAWSVVLTLAGAAVGAAAFGGMVSGSLAVAWFVGLAGLAAARAAGWGRQRPARALVASLGATGLYLALLAGLGPRAERVGRAMVAAERGAQERVLDVTHAPGPLDPLSWTVLVETERAVYIADLNLASGPRGLQRLERLDDDPRVRAAIDSECAAAWRSFVRHPHAALTEGAEGAWVELMDARYQRSPSAVAPGRRPAGSWCSAEVLVDAGGVPHCDS
jgi:inner membrane protein